MQVVLNAEFRQWLTGLRDRRAAAHVKARLGRVEEGNLGDSHSVGGGVHELRLHHGPGYRLYFIREGEAAVFLWGGVKESQQRDIRRARLMARERGML